MRDDKASTPANVGIGLMADAPERDEIRLIEAALKIVPVGLVAERLRRRAVGARNAIVVGDDRVAMDFDVRGRR
jgi:hypothetical protein